LPEVVCRERAKKKLTEQDRRSIKFYEKNGYPGKHGVPVVFETYKLCKKFGWTPSQIDKEDDTVLDQFLQIIEITNDWT